MLSSQLLQAMLSVELVITPSALLSKRLYSHFKPIQTKGSTKLPTILSLTEWLKNFFTKHTALRTDKALLNPAQSLLLWTQNNSYANLSTASSAYAAWCFYHTWELNYNDLLSPYPAHKAWRPLADAFRARCELHKSIDYMEMIPTLIACNAFNAVPKKIGLVGFSECTRQEKRLFTYLSQKGCHLRFITDPPIYATEKAKVIVFQQEHDERTTMAHWAWQNFNTYPERRIVCAIPNLRIQRTSILSTFTYVYRALSKQSTLTDAIAMPFESTSLSQAPIIQAALNILQLTPSIETAQISSLLCSPYVSHATDRLNRIQLDRRLRGQGNPLITYEQLRQHSKDTNCDTLLRCLTQWKEEYRLPNTMQRPAGWVQYWKRQLQNWNWTSTSPLSEEEAYYQEAWSNLLEKFCSLDSILSAIYYKEAIQILLYLADHERLPFQVSCPPHSIQLVDYKDIKQCYGDAFWLLNKRAQFPFSPVNNAFIPHAVQQSLQEPCTIKSIQQRLTSQGKAVISSYTQTEQLKSDPDTLTELLPLDQLKLAPYLSLAEQMQAFIGWEYFEDSWGPNITESHTIGGTDVLKKQAICPFSAFSDYRLSLKQSSVALPSRFLSYYDRSNCLHRILASLWTQLGSQDNLRQLQATQLEQLLKNTISYEVAKFVRQKPYIWQPTFVQLEKERFYHLLVKWFSMERERPSFKVQAVEYTTATQIGPLSLSIRIDRIDQLADNSLLIIDYKHGTQTMTRQCWMDERINEPQLPLYALSMQGVQAITWVYLQSEQGGKFLGVAGNDIAITSITPSTKQKPSSTWHDLLSQWQINLEKIAEEFYRGYAVVQPKEGEASCKHCQYPLLCRIKQSNS